MVLQLLRTLECIKVYLCIKSIISNNYSCIGETSHIWLAFLKQQKRQKDGKKYLSPTIRLPGRTWEARPGYIV